MKITDKLYFQALPFRRNRITGATNSPARFFSLVLAVCFLLLAGGCEREALVHPEPDTVPPLPPAGLLVEVASDGLIFIGWLKNTERDLRDYIIYRSEFSAGGPFTAIDTTTRNFYLDGQRSYDTTYYYYVTATDQSGNESAPSIIVSAVSPNNNPPEAPDIIYASGHNMDGLKYIRLEWHPVEEYDIAGYNIYRSEIPDLATDPGILLGTTESAIFDDFTIAETGRSYYYSIESVDNGGKRSERSPVRSDYITDVPMLISPPDFAQVKGFPVFSWQPVMYARQYRISVSTSPISGEIWAKIIDDDGRQTYETGYYGPPVYLARAYYWRVATLTKENGRQNAVSNARLFQIIQ